MDLFGPQSHMLIAIALLFCITAFMSALEARDEASDWHVSSDVGSLWRLVVGCIALAVCIGFIVHEFGASKSPSYAKLLAVGVIGLFGLVNLSDALSSRPQDDALSMTPDTSSSWQLAFICVAGLALIAAGGYHAMQMGKSAGVAPSPPKVALDADLLG